MNRSDEKPDAQKDALTRRMPETPASEATDPQTRALSENRAGAHDLPADGDPTIDAMSNSFDLDEGASREDPTTDAMTEQRKVVRDKDLGTPR